MLKKEKLVDTLLELKHNINSVDDVFDKEDGICSNWSAYLKNSKTYNLVSELSLDWEHRTNDYWYPVPNNDLICLW